MKFVVEGEGRDCGSRGGCMYEGGRERGRKGEREKKREGGWAK